MVNRLVQKTKKKFWDVNAPKWGYYHSVARQIQIELQEIYLQIYQPNESLDALRNLLHIYGCPGNLGTAIHSVHYHRRASVLQQGGTWAPLAAKTSTK